MFKYLDEGRTQKKVIQYWDGTKENQVYIIAVSNIFINFASDEVRAPCRYIFLE